MEKQGYHIPKLTRMIDLKILTDGSCKSPFPELDESLGQVHNTTVLRLQKNTSYRVYDKFDEAQVNKKENGDLTVPAPMSGDEWLIGFSLSFGMQIDIIESVYLEDIVAEQVKKIYEKYRSRHRALVHV